MSIVISEASVSEQGVLRVLESHLRFAAENSPPGFVFALDAEGLAEDAKALYAARVDDDVVGIGALRALDDAHVEIKSMHTLPRARGRGVARALLQHLIDEARVMGAQRISLETGCTDAFLAARALYERFGFRLCDAFGAYAESPHSVCMTLELAKGPRS